MTTTKKPSGRASSMPGGLAAGALAELLMTVGLAALGAKLIDLGYFQENAIGYFAMGILLLSSFVGAVIAAGRIKRRRLLVCILSGAVYFGMLLSMTALFFGGQYSGVGVTAIMVLCGVGLSILAGFRGERGGKRRKIKGVYR